MAGGANRARETIEDWTGYLQSIIVGGCPLNKHTNLVWIVALGLGWGFDFLFWGNPLGINFAIYLTACLLGGALVLLTNGLKPAFKSLGLVLPFVFFAIITFVRMEPLTIVLSIMGTLVSLGLLTVTYLGGRWTHYSLFDYFKKFFLLIGNIILLPIIFLRERKVNLDGVRRVPIKPVVRGLLIAIPVVVFFAILLAAGDIVFKQQIINFFDRFDLGRIPEYIARLIIILCWAYVLMGVFLYAALKSHDEKLLGEDKPIISHFLGFTEAAIVLGSVFILFLLFVIVQFRYFFGGEANIGVEGYTYSEYARSGFSELIAVAFFSLLMVLGLGTVTNRESDRQKRIYSGLSVGIVVLVIVILVSAYQRLTLAIDWHGFSRLRLYPRIFLIWVGILFVAVIVLEILHRERHFAFAMLLAALGFAITICALNVDGAIVRHNVYRTIDVERFNVNYLTTLSADAVPWLEEAWMDPTLPTKTHDGVGAALACYLQSEMHVRYSKFDWRSLNLSRWTSVNALNRVGPHLQDYRVSSNEGHYQVETPDHQVLYQCDQPILKGRLPNTSGIIP